MATTPPQSWELTVDGHAHRVEVEGSVRRRVRWWVDGELHGEKRSAEDTIRVEPADDGEDPAGLVVVRFGGLGSPRRATLHAGADAGVSAAALTGLGGVDLEPEVGSPAARYEERVRAHPRRLAVVAGVGGVAKVVVPILLVLLLSRVAISLPWPDWRLPRIPFPDLPDLPDLPSIPLPDLPRIPWPDVTLPGWLLWLLDNASYVVPVVVALVLARAEVRRRRAQDELRAARRAEAQEESGDEPQREDVEAPRGGEADR